MSPLSMEKYTESCLRIYALIISHCYLLKIEKIFHYINNQFCTNHSNKEFIFVFTPDIFIPFNRLEDYFCSYVVAATGRHSLKKKLPEKFRIR